MKEEGKPQKKELTLEQIQHVKPLLKARIPIEDGPGCWLCKWIFEDLEKNQKLTDYPKGHSFGEPGKYRHLQLEGMIK
jgi:hypothetical protein